MKFQVESMYPRVNSKLLLAKYDFELLTLLSARVTDAYH